MTRWMPWMVATLAAVAAADAGDLLVSSRFSNNVLRYDDVTGAFVSAATPGGLANIRRNERRTARGVSHWCTSRAPPTV